jgi:hypothetical protein
MTGPATIGPKKSGANIGDTGHSRRSNFCMPAAATARFMARDQDSLSPSPAAANIGGDEHTRGSFRHDVEGNLQEIAGKPRVYIDTGPEDGRSSHNTSVREISRAGIAQRLISVGAVSI